LVQEIFEENQSNMLLGAILWTRMLAADSLLAAEQQESKLPDPRLLHSWDPDRILGSLLSQTLNLKRSVAWDVYLLYPPEHRWTDELPPAPEFWMHQLDGENPALFLDPLRLKSTVQAMARKNF